MHSGASALAPPPLRPRRRQINRTTATRHGLQRCELVAREQYIIIVIIVYSNIIITIIVIISVVVASLRRYRIAVGNDALYPL